MQGFGRRLAVDRSFLTGENRALFCLVEKILKTRRLIARIAAIRQRNWCEPVRTQGSPRWKPGDHARVDAAPTVGSVRSLPLAACRGVVRKPLARAACVVRKPLARAACVFRKPPARAGGYRQEAPGGNRGVTLTVNGHNRLGVLKPGRSVNNQKAMPGGGPAAASVLVGPDPWLFHLPAGGFRNRSTRPSHPGMAKVQEVLHTSSRAVGPT